MTAILAVVLALQAATIESSDEARALDYLRQARIREFSAWTATLPEQSDLGALCVPWGKRLGSLQTLLLDAINRGGVECEIKDVHPDALKNGKIVGATAATLEIQDGERKRTLVWSGLPAAVTYGLAERYLRDEAQKDPALKIDLAEALGLGPALADLKPAWAKDLALADEVRASLSKRGYAEAKDLLGRRAPGETDGPSLRLSRLWVNRLTATLAARAGRKADLERGLPKGAALVFYEEFEGGPELMSEGWVKGFPIRRPGPAAGSGLWCLRSTFMATRWMFGELTTHYDFKQAGLPPPALDEQLHLACRIWASNVRTVSFVMEASTDADIRNSRIDIPLRAQEEWIDVRIRLGDVTLHRPILSGDRSATLVALQDRIQVFRFEADRDDGRRKDGYFLVDRLVFSTQPFPSR